jgi:hypothetical protein
MLGIGMTSALATFGWATRRILARIDSIGDKMEAINVRVAVIETKQDDAGEVARVTERVARKTARKVGVMPRDLENTQPHPRLG